VKNDEQAFPAAGSERNRYMPGMSLRDWFAGMAMHGAVWTRSTPTKADYRDYVTTARVCYQIADALLKARDEAE
jgi:hypothetical protein